MKLNFFKKDKLPKWLLRAIAPDPGRLAYRRRVFLAAYDRKFGTAAISPLRWAFVARVAAGVLIMLGITGGGLSVYADANNVPANSPLYPLKRFNESVQLILSKREDKPQLQMQLAERRTKEIDALKKDEEKQNSKIPATKEANETLIHGLQKDLHEKIDGSIEDAEKPEFQKEKLSAFCEKFASTIVTSSFAIREELAQNAELLRRFQDKCTDKKDNNEANGNEKKVEEKQAENGKVVEDKKETQRAPDVHEKGGNSPSVENQNGEDGEKGR